MWPWSGLGAALPELSEGQPVRQPLPAGLSLAAPTAALRYRVVPLCGPRLRFRAVCCRAASTQRVPFHTGCRGRKQPQLADTSRCIAPCRLLYRSGEPRRLSSRAAWLCVSGAPRLHSASAPCGGSAPGYSPPLPGPRVACGRGALLRLHRLQQHRGGPACRPHKLEHGRSTPHTLLVQQPKRPLLWLPRHVCPVIKLTLGLACIVVLHEPRLQI